MHRSIQARCWWQSPPVAWARIYLGVHFPLDMLGAALVALLSAWSAFRAERWYLPATYKLALRLDHILFGRLIQMRWVRKWLSFYG